MSSIASLITKTKASDLSSCFIQKQLEFGKGHNKLKKIEKNKNI